MAGFHEARRPAIPIRNVEQADLAAVLALNEHSVPAVNSLTAEKLEWFVGEAASFRVAVLSSSIAGFLICLPPEAPYGSPNFRWLIQRYEDFLYIDRIAIVPAFRRRGIASALYKDAVAEAGSRYRMLACEVNLRPRNRESLDFHDRLGFKPVGTHDHGSVIVQYMVRSIPPQAGEARARARTRAGP